MARIISFCFCFLLVNILIGQQSLVINTNKAFYSSGESIGFIVKNSSNQVPEVVYVDFFNEKQELIERITLKSNGLMANGKIELPLNLESGWYTIRALNLAYPNLEVKDLGYKTIPIYNEFDATLANKDLIVPPLNLTKGDFNIDSYASGKQIEVKISGTSVQSASYSASVIDKESFQLKQYFEKVAPTYPKYEFKPLPAEAQPVSKLLFLGKVGKRIENVLSAMYVAEEKTSSWVSLNEENVFGLEMEDFQGVKNAQMIGVDPLGKLVYQTPELFQPFDNVNLPDIDFPALPYPKEVVDYLENSRKRRIVTDLFVKDLPIAASSIIEEKDFPKPDKSFAPKDYVLFTDMKDFVTEVVTLLKIYKVEDEITFRILLGKNRLGNHEPLMFLNGSMVTDPSVLLEVDLNNLEKIDIYRKQETLLEAFNALGRNGAVAVYTKDKKLKPEDSNQIKLGGFQNIESSIMPAIYDDAPSFSPNLYWNPNIELTEENSFSFPATNDKGDYIIQIEQISTEGFIQSNSTITLK